ncbi:hypothetical protein OG413_34275 [Streptomyces sp. NBC_01433]|uniref:hypothetical protein n=1 Tax=Streptomyces sp. NBC_01433 TaxID=2903864 RepID=UPI00224D3DFD|nr:hypothetical protein [Streptomyces sp. NBC_01433]MCX4680284.1 hypothetical protein [Streptomyces sp. NBC_01433]
MTERDDRDDVPSGEGGLSEEGGGRSVAGRVPTSASVLAAAGKSAVVGPLAVMVSYVDAQMVRASTGEFGWLFGTEFWLMVLILAGLRVQGWTEDDDRWVGVFVLGILVAGLVAGPLLLFHGALVALAAVPGVVVVVALGCAVARTCGFEANRWGSRGR